MKPLLHLFGMLFYLLPNILLNGFSRDLCTFDVLLLPIENPLLGRKNLDVKLMTKKRTKSRRMRRVRMETERIRYFYISFDIVFKLSAHYFELLFFRHKLRVKWPKQNQHQHQQRSKTQFLRFSFNRSPFINTYVKMGLCVLV